MAYSSNQLGRQRNAAVERRRRRQPLSPIKIYVHPLRAHITVIID